MFEAAPPFYCVAPAILVPSAPHAPPTKARAKYIVMMRAHDCETPAYQILDAIEASYPYTNDALRSSGVMVAEAGVALDGERYNGQTDGNATRNTNPGGC